MLFVVIVFVVTCIQLTMDCCRFDEKEQLIGVNNVKSSVQKGIRSKLMEQFPFIEDYLEQIIPKKDPLRIAKW